MSISAPCRRRPSRQAINSTNAGDILGLADAGNGRTADVLPLSGFRIEPAPLGERVQARGVACGADGAGVNGVDLHSITQPEIGQSFRQRE
jgi:hypothetical protein